MAINDMVLGSTTNGLGQYVGDCYPWYPQPYVVPTITVGSYWPTFCSGDVHVWACEHATTCKCGKATRQVEPRACPCCGKKV